MIRRIITLLIVIATGLAGYAGSGAAATVNHGYLRMTSDPGDFIGQGLQYNYTFPERDIIVSAAAASGGYSVHSVPDGSIDFWDVRFRSADGAPLAPGVYGDAQRVGFQSPGHPGLDVSLQGRGCSTLSGDFTVLEATTAPDGTFRTFHATFNQTCGGSTGQLHGEILVEIEQVPTVIGVQLTTTSFPFRQPTVYLEGTTTCNEFGTLITINGTVSQSSAGSTNAVSVPFSTASYCSFLDKQGSPWVAVLILSREFRPGTARVNISARSENGTTTQSSQSLTISAR